MTIIQTKESARVIDGRRYAAEYLADVAKQVKCLKERWKIELSIALIIVGEDPASKIYVNNKMKRAQEIGIKVHLHQFDQSLTATQLLQAITQLNQHTKVQGILLQLPLPPHLDANLAINQIHPNKDIDGFHHINVGKLNTWQECLEPGTPKGVLLLIKHVLGQDLSGLKAVVIGRSQIVGRPMASMLLRENCTVTIAHSHSLDLAAEARTADILVSAVGKPHMVKANWIKPGACVIDVGIVRHGEKLYGDIDYYEVVQIAGAVTPVPGGVGPMTVACMLGNAVKAACMQHDITMKDLCGDAL